MRMIEVEDLSVKYLDIEALSGVTFAAEAGDYIGIVGPNGSGKTTLIKALLGLVPFTGKVFFNGKAFSEFTHNRHVGYLPQKMSFYDPRFPAVAREIVASGAYCCKKFPKRLFASDHSRAMEAMEMLGIAELAGRPIGKLSGGEQQRVLLARSLVHSPEVLILDEPTAALDPSSRETFYKTVRDLNREKGVTVLLVSHDAATIGEYAGKLLYLDGKVIFYGSFGEFCGSETMTRHFGAGQHIICHRH
ncbi:MAG: metal ABC transporter ATP-binding protein [Candidatus Omnitrophica bacterium]|nr:metal ABC transporter ATP-binding protein [Candidatus Omnitrophota bacterium]